MINKFGKFIGVSALLALAPLATSSAAESGFYMGGSIGQSGVELDLSDGTPGVPGFDEDDFAWKIFGGYNFGLLPLVDLGIEGGYVDLGGPSVDVSDTNLGLTASAGVDATALDVFGVVGVGLGPIDVFGKLGLVFWDAESTLSVTDTNDPNNDFSESFSDDGNDLAYGIGARFALGQLEIRGEYELFDIEDTDSVSMLSVGLVFHFD